MVRWIRLLGVAWVAVALAASGASAQTTPQTATPHQTTQQKRAKDKAVKPKEEGRQITVRKETPSWLTLGGSAEVGSHNGYVYDTFNQPTPIEGTFTGLRGRERITDQFGNPGPGITLFRF
jgi:hypothetical protein